MRASRRVPDRRAARRASPERACNRRPAAGDGPGARRPRTTAGRTAGAGGDGSLPGATGLRSALAFRQGDELLAVVRRQGKALGAPVGLGLFDALA